MQPMSLVQCFAIPHKLICSSSNKNNNTRRSSSSSRHQQQHSAKPNTIIMPSSSSSSSSRRNHHNHQQRKANPNPNPNPKPNNNIVIIEKEEEESICAHQSFDGIPLTEDTFPWNSLLRSHLAQGKPREAILLYRHMILRGACPDRHTLPRVLTAASRLSHSTLTPTAKQLHAHALKLGLASDPYVVTALMGLYARFGGAQAASTVFHHHNSSSASVAAWTLLAKLYTVEGNPALALQSFHNMLAAGADFDSVALLTAVKACAHLKSLHQGRKVHDIAKTRGLDLHPLVANSLLNMYLECQRMGDARQLFDRMPSRDAVSWTTIILGYVQAGGFNEGLKLFAQMFAQGVRPDAFAISAVLPACARMAAHKQGKEIHGHVIRHAVPINPTVENALMDMYIKSGSLEAASRIFRQMVDRRDAVSWTVMMMGYSLHGQGQVGVALFHEMQEQAGLVPDREAYAAALHACNTALMVEQGRIIFDRIRGGPDVEHCALMVALLSSAGLFDEARALIVDHQIEIGAQPDMLRAMLSGCRSRRQNAAASTSTGKRIAEQLIELEPLNAENYVLLSNIYAASAKWDKVKELRETIRDMGLKPKSGYSWIELRGKVHVFSVGDVSHPRSEKIYWELQRMQSRMEQEVGYCCALEEDFSLHDVDEERECIPSGHSEMLAVAFGLISTPERATVHVTKNLRVCRNCHALLKMISKCAAREIVLKDHDRFHHFKDGSCSCRNIW